MSRRKFLIAAQYCRRRSHSAMTALAAESEPARPDDNQNKNKENKS